MAKNKTPSIAQQQADSFVHTQWLHAVYEPHDSAKVVGNQEEVWALLEDDPDAFFESPYAKPYENWCIEDHNAGANFDAKYKDSAKEVSWLAYEAAWGRCPHEEFCALVSDDVQTIYSLLLITDCKLRLFTAARMEWYLKGRVPWGYKGEFPKGSWIII